MSSVHFIDSRFKHHEDLKEQTGTKEKKKKDIFLKIDSKTTERKRRKDSQEAMTIPDSITITYIISGCNSTS